MAESVEQAIRRVAGRYAFPDPELLVAVAKQESGLNPRAQGDYVRGAPQSFGIFQENVRGRGAGLAPEQSFDVAAATERAVREFNAIRAKNPSVDRGAWAALAQRPADPSGYARSVNALLGQTAPRSPQEPPPGANAPEWYRDLTGAVDLLERPGTAPGRRNLPEERLPAGHDPSWYRELLGSASASGQAGAPGGLFFTLEGQSPERNRLTNPFGAPQVRSSGFSGSLPPQNYGVDIAAAVGTPVHAPAGARVKNVLTEDGPNYGYGNSVVLDLGGGVELQLSHLRDAPGYRPGDPVRAGEVVGRVGLTGNTTGPHTDHALRVDGRPTDFFRLYDDPAIQQRLGASAASPGSAPSSGASGDEPEWYRELMR